MEHATDILPNNQQPARFQRVRVNLLGRYMLADHREFPCQVIEMSPGGLSVAAPVSGVEGERVIAYIDHVGRLEGQIVRLLPHGFTMTISATARKRDKLAAQLSWLVNRHVLGAGEGRRRENLIPLNARTTIVLSNGTVVSCRIIDMSLSGASIASETVPPVGSLIRLGKIDARVVYHLDGGFGVEFAGTQERDTVPDMIAAS